MQGASSVLDSLFILALLPAIGNLRTYHEVLKAQNRSLAIGCTMSNVTSFQGSVLQGYNSLSYALLPSIG